MIVLFGIASFLSALLLFWSQPLWGRMLLPFLGGAPSVWITGQFLFQLMLLAGYYYSHRLSRLPFRANRHRAIHMALLGAAFLTLPFVISGPWRSILSQKDLPPVLWLAGVLITSAGFPVAVLSASSPLLQKWFSQSSLSGSSDPYFLYAASNFGSLLGLLGYPFLIEPLFPLRSQVRIWKYGFAVLFFFFAWIALKIRKFPSTGSDIPAGDVAPGSPPANTSAGLSLHWMFLAFVPSSLMLGITTFLTGDIASFPLLWVLPLSIYLLTFILAFSRKKPDSGRIRLQWLPRLTVLFAFIWLAEIRTPVWIILSAGLIFLFFTALSFHLRLAELRPPPVDLTRFYLLISLGGSLGGCFNSVIAPLVFRRIAEVPWVVSLMFLLSANWRRWRKDRSLRVDLLFPVLLFFFTALLAVKIPQLAPASYPLWIFLIFGLPLLIVYLCLHRPVRFSLALAAVFSAGLFFHAVEGKTLFTGRNFFGTIKVALHPDRKTVRLFHGTTLHGMQYMDPRRKDEPLAYYHRLGPFGQVMERFHEGTRSGRIGVIGVGVGSMLAYAAPDETWTYFEIDPEIVWLARESGIFSYFRGTRARRVRVVTGDARLRLEESPDASFDLLVLDAFTSDVVPAHLLTREAFSLYLRKISPHGIIAAHISSQNLNLQPVIFPLVLSLRLRGLVREDMSPAPEKLPSTWVVLTKSEEDLGRLPSDQRWRRISPISGKVWTDDYVNIIRVIRWF